MGVDHLYIIEILPADATNEDDWQLTSFVYFQRENAEEDLETHREIMGDEMGILDVRVSEWWRTSWA